MKAILQVYRMAPPTHPYPVALKEHAHRFSILRSYTYSVLLYISQGMLRSYTYSVLLYISQGMLRSYTYSVLLYISQGMLCQRGLRDLIMDFLSVHEPCVCSWQQHSLSCNFLILHHVTT